MDKVLNIRQEIFGMRTLSDRRKHPTPVLSRHTFRGGKRKNVRREADKKRHVHVDLYSARLAIAACLILALSCLDAYLTIILIGTGKVAEANPAMAYLLKYGTSPFMIIKYAVTAFSLLILCLFKNLKIARYGLPFALMIYIAIIIYEFYLFMI